VHSESTRIAIVVVTVPLDLADKSAPAGNPAPSGEEPKRQSYKFSERIAERLRRSGMKPTRLVLKDAFLYVAGFAFSMCTVLHGQTIIGTWQGTLPAKETQRIVLKFAKADNNGSLRGSLTFIDRGPSGPPLLSVTFAPPDLSVTVADISYRGKLSADDKSIRESGRRATRAIRSPSFLRLRRRSGPTADGLQYRRWPRPQTLRLR
jgi:hypothetical protein